MNRRDLLRHLKKHGCELYREGSRHSIWWNPANQQTTAVPRHTQVLDQLAWKICKDLGIPAP